jgi:hypothetical protein
MKLPALIVEMISVFIVWVPCIFCFVHLNYVYVPFVVLFCLLFTGCFVCSVVLVCFAVAVCCCFVYFVVCLLFCSVLFILIVATPFCFVM